MIVGEMSHVPTTLPSVPQDVKAFNRPELDVLRFFAFLLVFLAHSTPKAQPLFTKILTCGVFGVSVFFVLSSYLITELLQLEKKRTGTIQIGSFYLRRILRIWPLFFVFIGAYWLKGQFEPEYAIPKDVLLSLLLFAGNFWTGRHGFFPSPLAPLWSVSVEEQFYLLWPGLILLLSRRRAAVFSLILFPIAAVALVVLSFGGADPVDHVWTNSFVQFQAFGCGGLLALWLRAREPAFSGLQRASFIAAGIVSFFLAEFVFQIHGVHPPSLPNYLCGYACIDAGACCLLLGVLGYKPARTWKVLRYLGRISYGLYVLHLAALWASTKVTGAVVTPGRWLVATPIALISTIFAASVSYTFLESPFIRLKQRFAPVRSHTV